MVSTNPGIKPDPSPIRSLHSRLIETRSGWWGPRPYPLFTTPRAGARGTNGRCTYGQGAKHQGTCQGDHVHMVSEQAPSRCRACRCRRWMLGICIIRQAPFSSHLSYLCSKYSREKIFSLALLDPEKSVNCPRIG